MKICLEKYVRWKRLHNALKTLERVDFSRSFLFYTVNDVRRKPYMVEIHSTVEKRAKRTPDTTVETTNGITNRRPDDTVAWHTPYGQKKIPRGNQVVIYRQSPIFSLVTKNIL